MPTVTGELHRSQARFSPVNFTEYPRFLMPANTSATYRVGLRARRLHALTEPNIAQTLYAADPLLVRTRLPGRIRRAQAPRRFPLVLDLPSN
jgi:hypothetical protein